jgi:hypothetical protein
MALVVGKDRAILSRQGCAGQIHDYIATIDEYARKTILLTL